MTLSILSILCILLHRSHRKLAQAASNGTSSDDPDAPEAPNHVFRVTLPAGHLYVRDTTDPVPGMPSQGEPFIPVTLSNNTTSANTTRREMLVLGRDDRYEVGTSWPSSLIAYVASSLGSSSSFCSASIIGPGLAITSAQCVYTNGRFRQVHYIAPGRWRGDSAPYGTVGVRSFITWTAYTRNYVRCSTGTLKRGSSLKMQLWLTCLWQQVFMLPSPLCAATTLQKLVIPSSYLMPTMRHGFIFIRHCKCSIQPVACTCITWMMRLANSTSSQQAGLLFACRGLSGMWPCCTWTSPLGRGQATLGGSGTAASRPSGLALPDTLVGFTVMLTGASSDIRSYGQ